MSSYGAVPILKLGDNLIVTVSQDLHDAAATNFQTRLLAAIESRATQGLLIDLSALVIVDSYVARVLAETAQMAQLMGSRTVICGMQPAVAATLVAMGFFFDGIGTALNVEYGVELLERERRP